MDKPEINFGNEVTLTYCLRVLWKWKRFVILGTILPALAVAVIVFFWPKNYTLTAVYEQTLTEKDYRVLLDRFYSAENINKIITELQKNQLNKFAAKIKEATDKRTLNKLINVQVTPAFPIRLKTIDPATSEKIGSLDAQLVNITIVAKPEKEIEKTARVIMDNFENIMPLYYVKHELNNDIRGVKNRIADIQQQRFSLVIGLDRQRATLEKLKAVQTDTSTNTDGGIILQFNNVGDTREYLPLSNQIQVAESRIIEHEETINENEKMYNYSQGVLGLNEKIFNEIENKFTSYYTIEQFHSFLLTLSGDCKTKEIEDYLKSYIIAVENKMLAAVPVTENPKVYPVSIIRLRGIGIIFVASLIVSAFAVVLWELNN